MRCLTWGCQLVGCLRHDPETNGLEEEDEADKLASHWRFSREIKEMRRKFGPPTNGRKNFRSSNYH